MPDLHYTDHRLVQLYDAECGWSADRQFNLNLAGTAPQRILDLGCGTGLLCNAYAALGHDVTGVDPAAAMLMVARQKPHSARVTWVQAAGQDYDSQGKFDLIIMTGHAFQVLLDDADIAATFTTAHKYLAPGGRFVFESRNPAIDWASRWHGSSTDLAVGRKRVVISRKVLLIAPEYITWDTTYTLPDTTLTSQSTLRFLSNDQIAARLQDCGLHLDALYGDWDESPFQPNASDEMIFVASLASR